MIVLQGSQKTVHSKKEKRSEKEMEGRRREGKRKGGRQKMKKKPNLKQRKDDTP